MVRLWPRVKSREAEDAELEAFFRALRALEMPARTGDLRFLDAFNNAYEALFEDGPPTDDPRAGWFLEAYARLIEVWLQRNGT